MSRTCLPYNPDRQLLLPQALQEWQPQDHLAYFISQGGPAGPVGDLGPPRAGAAGGPPYNLTMTVKVLFYGYRVGVPSSRRIARRSHEDNACRALAANNTPNFRTISHSCKDHLAALSELFPQVLMLWQWSGLLKLGHVALDWTKWASASKHKTMSCQRMKEKEAQLSAEVEE